MGIMVGIQDFESCETSGQFYGGNAGRKIGLVWRDGDWLVKFPGTTRNLQGSVPSYTTAPVSGWIGVFAYSYGLGHGLMHARDGWTGMASGVEVILLLVQILNLAIWTYLLVRSHGRSL